MTKDIYDKIWAEVPDALRRSHYTGRVFTTDDLAETINTEDELKTALGCPQNHRWRAMLAHLAGLCYALRHLTAPQDGLHEFPISTLSKGMLSRFGSWQNGSKVMGVARKVGLVVCTDEYYGSGAGLSKCYIWDKRTEALVLALAKAENVRPTLPINRKKNKRNADDTSPTSSVSSSAVISPSLNGATTQVGTNNEKNTSCNPSSTSHTDITPPLNGATTKRGLHLGRTRRQGTMTELEEALVLAYP